MEKDTVEKLINSRVGSVTIDTAIPQEMKDAFARNRIMPYKAKDFEGECSSEDDDPVDGCTHRLLIRVPVEHRVPTSANGWSTPFLARLNDFIQMHGDDAPRLRFVKDGIVVGFTEASVRDAFGQSFSDYAVENFHDQSSVVSPSDLCWAHCQRTYFPDLPFAPTSCSKEGETYSLQWHLDVLFVVNSDHQFFLYHAPDRDAPIESAKFHALSEATAALKLVLRQLYEDDHV